MHHVLLRCFLVFFALFETLDLSEIVMQVASYSATLDTLSFSSLRNVAFKFLLFVLPQILDQ